MVQTYTGVEIKSISGCIPAEVIKNSRFDYMLNPKEQRAFEKTVGILERRWADKNVTASDLAYEAICKLLSVNLTNKDEIDCLLFLSQTPDYKIPFTSNLLQDRLKLKKDVLCLDINAGCAGFIQGLSVAFSLASNLRRNGKVLLVVAETLSKILSIKDRGTTMLFGDGAAAVLIENTGNERAKSSFNFFSDGSNFDSIKISDGGFRNEVNAESFIVSKDKDGNEKCKLDLEMDGAKVFDFTMREVALGIKQLLDNLSIPNNKIDYFLFHQSNRFIIKQISNQLGIEPEKALLNIEELGNTSSVSIPLLILSHIDKIKHSESVLMSGYGSGLNWANCITNLANVKLIPKIEYSGCID